MAEIRSIDNPKSAPQGNWAPLTNVSLAAAALSRAMTRGRGMHGVVALYGPTGIGKSQAALYCENRYDCVYVQCQRLWSKKSMLLGIARAMGLAHGRTATEIFDQVAEQLKLSRRPLILDEADYIVGKEHLDVLRDLYEVSRCTLMIIGEERLPRTLKAASERFHNRVLRWEPAQLATEADCRKLADFYVPGLAIADDMLPVILEASGRVASRIRIQLDELRHVAESDGLKRIDRATWGRRQLSAGDGPVRSFR